MTGVSPHAALAAARSLLAARPGPRDASIAHQAAAIVLRDFGDVTAAIREFRLAARLARAAADPEREADVLTSLGTALVMAGRTRAGLAALDEASTQAASTQSASTQSASTQSASTGAGAALGRVLVRRGASLHIAGRYDQARADLRQAIMLTRRTGEVVWEARAHTAAALADLATGATARAEAGFTAAEALFAGTGQQLEIAYARHNRALVAFAGGDLPAALRHLDDAAARYAGLGVEVPDAALDRCAVLLAAGLTADALAAAETALGGPATPAKKAELLLAAARTALAAGQYRISAERADRARRMFRLQHRERWRTHAALVVLQARFLAGRPPGPLLPPARRTAARLAELRSDEAPDAWLLAGRIALAAASRPSPGRRVRPGDAARRQAEADRLLAAAALAARRRLPAFARATGWLAEALRAEQHGDQRRLLAACRRGFGLLEEHLATLGAAELRAHATAHGAELAGLAQRAALRSGRPRLLLAWSERWRAVTLGSLVHPAAVAPAHPAAVAPAIDPVNPTSLTEPADPTDHDDRAALRDVSVRLERAEPGGFPATVLQRERLRLEAAIRGRALRAHPAGTAVATPFDAGVLLDALGPARLLELVVVDGDLHVLVCGGGRVRRLAAGTVAQAAREVDFARFGLSRIARGRLAEPAGQALAVLAETGRRLDALLLGTARDHVGDGPVIVVPPGRLNAVPWALLPSLAGREVSVAPSARSWLRARQATSFGREKVVLVSGPGLDAARAEVGTLAAEYERAAVLAGGDATTARVLGALDGAGLAHIAAHGVFRADSPMFSSLRLADGPMTVHDVERLGRAPYRLILPSCESGRLAPAGADELLGLASALLPLGTAGIVASVAQVGDRAAAPLMLALHRRLRGNASLAAALRGARADVGTDDPELAAAGWSFIALGA
ncbi:MAG TPA: CHAT domain-containing protein [Streptosporangiaceae bacterium]